MSGRGKRNRGGGRSSGSSSYGVCFSWAKTGTCSYGSRCKFRHDSTAAGRSGASKKIKRTSDETNRFVRHLSQVPSTKLEAQISASHGLWRRSWQEHSTLDDRTRRLLVEILAKIPGSALLGPPPIQLVRDVVCAVVKNECGNRAHPDHIITIVETVDKVVTRLLQFEWESTRDDVKKGVADILLTAEGRLMKQNKEHRDIASTLMGQLEDLEKPWRIGLKEATDLTAEDIETEPTSYSSWQSATIQWLSTPSFFTPSSLPVMKVPKSKTAGVYDSAEDYMDTVHRLWLAMTFYEGFAALSPHCRARGQSGNACQGPLWPIAETSDSSNLRCRTRNCRGIVGYACRSKGHDALCGSCASSAFANNLKGPGANASTHIYDGQIKNLDPDGLLHISSFKSRNPPHHPIHWRSTRRLSPPNLVGLVKLRSRGAHLSPSDSIKWGEMVFHGRPQDEERRRLQGELAVNLASIIEFDPDYFEEGDQVAVIDCMTFVPEWLPVLAALEKQQRAILPFENGRHLNLWRDQPPDLSNSVLVGSTPENVCDSPIPKLIGDMVDQSRLKPIQEIRRDENLKKTLLTKLSDLVTNATLDKMQLISFTDSLRNPVHLTQGPPGTGKSYLGVVIVRALVVIRDLWVKKSRTVGTPPILVLSYKNHAIDEFLVDLVNAEPTSALRSRLIRIGGQCKDSRLLPYSERSAFRSDADVKCRHDRLQRLRELQDSIKRTIDTSISSFLAFRADMFDQHGVSEEDSHKKRVSAAYEATDVLLTSLVRREMLKEALALLESTDEPKDKSAGNHLMDAAKILSFLRLDSEQKVAGSLQSRLNRVDANALIKTLNEGVLHYRLPHLGDILHLWICGKIPLPLCVFVSARTGKQCDGLATMPDVTLCARHRCRFIDSTTRNSCQLQCVEENQMYCQNHVCSFEDCARAKLDNVQSFCKMHCCKKCIEDGVVSNAATDDPPRNVCIAHPMCIKLGCLIFCKADDSYCIKHCVRKCAALTTKGKPCKGEPVSWDLQYCRNHLHLARAVDLEEGELFDNLENEELQQAADGLQKCNATTKKGKRCKGWALPDSLYCYDHSPTEDRYSAKRSTVHPTPNFDVTQSLGGEPIESQVTLALSTDTSPKSHDESSTHNDSSDEECQFHSAASGSSEQDVVDKADRESNVDLDEIEIDEGQNLEHLRDVFEVGDDSTSDFESVSEGSTRTGYKTEADSVEKATADVQLVTCDPSSWTWSMNLAERWDACQSLMDEQRCMLDRALHLVKVEVISARKDLHKANIRAKARIYENRSVIGGTMVGCITRLEAIRSTRPFAVLVEEASEVLEPLLFSCLCESTMKLEMIGDHRQLQPSIMSRFDFEICNKVNVSMFQRLIEAPTGHEVPSTVLSVQRRMRKNICDLTRGYYKDVVAIEDHDTCNTQVIGQRNRSVVSSLVQRTATGGREIPGVAPHVFLWTHQGIQKKARVGLSRVNEHEAMMVCSLTTYLVQCGVPRPSITILTPYKGQLMHIRNLMIRDKTFSKEKLLSRNPQESSVCHLSTVDRFQGSENDIIIVSLVVDEKSRTAFVKLVNRLIVLLSRARLGMYILGNLGYFENNSHGIPKHWASTLEMLQASVETDSADNNVGCFTGCRVGREIPLCCPIHREVSVSVADPTRLKIGFCQMPCQEILPCQHACSMQCHWPRLKHNQVCSVEIESPCQKHPGKIACHQAYRHSPNAPADSDHISILAFYMCPKQVQLSLPCEHEVKLPCWEEEKIVTGKQAFPGCKEQSPSPYLYPACRHTHPAKCNELDKWTKYPSLAPTCRERVEFTPPCGHVKEMECGTRERYISGNLKFRCPVTQAYELPRCGHFHTLSCEIVQKLANYTGKASDEIGKVLEGVQYGPKDYVCREQSTFVRLCGHESQLPCEDAFDMALSCPPCSQKIHTKNRRCGHPCVLTCAQVQALKEVPIPSAIEQYVEGDIPTSILSLPQLKCQSQVNILRSCGHSHSLVCWRAGKSLPGCKSQIEMQSPLCGHTIHVPCHLKDKASRELWEAEALAYISENNEIPAGEALNADLSTIGSELTSALISCEKEVVFVKKCKHKIRMKCSRLIKTLQQSDGKCDEDVLLQLDCGHLKQVKCFESRAHRAGSKVIQCKAKTKKECWNFTSCSRMLEVTCGYKGLVACRVDSRWTCLTTKHTYMVDQCKNGIPASCPGCFMDEANAAIKTQRRLSQELLHRSFGQLPVPCVQWLLPNTSQFYSLEQRMLERYTNYLETVPPWERQVFNNTRVPCYRVLSKKENLSQESFSARAFAKQRTMFGILVKKLTKKNIQGLANQLKDESTTVTLLVGYASVARTKTASEFVAENPKAMLSRARQLQRDGFDSFEYISKGFDNLIIWEPFPLVACCRTELSTSQLADIAERLKDEPAYDLEAVQIDRRKPDGNFILGTPVADRKLEVDDDSLDGSQGGVVDELLFGTELEEYTIDLQWPTECIDKAGLIPESLQKDLLVKMQFVNSSAQPFLGIQILTELSKQLETPLIDLLLAAELTEHDTTRARDHFSRYLNAVRPNPNELHPWALVVGARVDKLHSKQLIAAFSTLFPTQDKILTPTELAEQRAVDVEPKEDISGDNDVMWSEWESLKESNPTESNSEAMDKLLKLTGLKKVKKAALQLWKTAMQLRQMDDEARKMNAVASNYCFLGNPGTGKTTVARLFAEILRDSGIRQSSAIEETTAQLAKDQGTDEFRNLVKKAMDGVLFIDEAYDLDPIGDFKGKPIVNELLTLCENYRDRISVVLAGYEDDFQKKFFAYNDGLKSRFEEVQFEDFDEKELRKIWKGMREAKKWDEAPGVCSVVVKRILKSAGRKGFGNAREVRKRLESATQTALTRLGDEFSMQNMRIETVDVVGEDPRFSEKLQDIRTELGSKVGWARIKKAFDELIEVCGISYERELAGEPPLEIFLNRMFLGNPGTGKTTGAKIYGRLLKQLGFLSNGDVVAKTAGDFVGNHVGESQNKTVQILEGARGKVLIIDEAYVLDDNLYGKQVLDTLVEKVQGAPSDDIAVLLLGYEEQMLQMLRNQNPGLARRFPKDYAFYFDDYSDNELLGILKRILKAQKVEATVEFLQKSINVLRIQRNQANFGNAGAVELLVKGALQKATQRRLEPSSKLQLHDSDVDDPGSARGSKQHDPLAQLDGLFRMDKIKKKLEVMKKTWAVAHREGGDSPDLGHFVFTGSAGTGKTTVARTIANVLYGLNLLPSDKIVETSGLELTAEYVGQTKAKVNEALRGAKGGVLFIDEAYSLGIGHFGKEACDTIVAAMTSDEFRDLVVVIAGYPQEIDEMLDTNSGLKSRFTHFFEFPDWDANDCGEFFNALAKKNNFTLDPSIVEVVQKGCTSLKALKGWGNGRDVTKLWEETLRQRAERVYEDPELMKSIILKDVTLAMNSMLHDRRPKEVPVVFSCHEMPSIPAEAMPSLAGRPQVRTESNQSSKEDAATSQENAKMRGESEEEAKPSSHVKSDSRDEGVSDEVWSELEAAKARDRQKEDELAMEEEDYQKFIKQQRLAEESVKEEMERIRRQVEKQRQEEALRKVMEAEEKRKHEAELMRKRLEEKRQKRLVEIRRKAKIQEKLHQLIPCPMGFHWHKTSRGWRCGGGSHFVTDHELQRSFTG